MLHHRVFTALWLVPLVLAALWAGSWYFGALLLALAVFAAWEAKGLLVACGYPSSMAILAGLPLALVVDVYGGRGLALPILVMAMILALTYYTWQTQPTPTSLASYGVGIGMALYLGLPLQHLAMLRSGTEGLWWAVWVIGGVWVNDTMAYIVGRLFGRHKLIPRISPGKTWEGTVGGILATTVASGLAGPLILGLAWAPSCLLGALIGMAGSIGDLVESYLKRAAGVKDSGRLLPGHGGVLDRIDSLLFVAPLVYYFRIAMVIAGLALA